jgi:hypothetical protein
MKYQQRYTEVCTAIFMDNDNKSPGAWIIFLRAWSRMRFSWILGRNIGGTVKVKRIALDYGY